MDEYCVVEYYGCSGVENHGEASVTRMSAVYKDRGDHISRRERGNAHGRRQGFSFDDVSSTPAVGDTGELPVITVYAPQDNSAYYSESMVYDRKLQRSVVPIREYLTPQAQSKNYDSNFRPTKSVRSWFLPIMVIVWIMLCFVLGGLTADRSSDTGGRVEPPVQTGPSDLGVGQGSDAGTDEKAPSPSKERPRNNKEKPSPRPFNGGVADV